MSRQIPPIRGDQDFKDCSAEQLFNFFADYKGSFKTSHSDLKATCSTLAESFIEEHLKEKIFVRKDKLSVLAGFLFYVDKKYNKAHEAFYTALCAEENINQSDLDTAIKKFTKEQENPDKSSRDDAEKLAKFTDNHSFWRSDAANRTGIKRPNPITTTTSNSPFLDKSSQQEGHPK